MTGPNAGLPLDQYTWADRDRLLSNYKISESGCWEWTLHTRGGYGRLTIRGKNVTAHRFSYRVHKGSVEGKVVMHTCDNSKCINPDHLKAGTQSDNINDAVAKGRQPRAQGSRNRNTHLTEELVLEIRRLFKEGVTQKELREKYNTGKTQTYYIVNRKSWKHI